MLSNKAKSNKNMGKHKFEELRTKDKIGVLFVCLGNICRSPAAEAMFRTVVEQRGDSARFELDSAGTTAYHSGQQPDKRMRVHALQRGIRLEHVCRRVQADDFERFDVIVGMDASNLQNLRQMAPSVEAARKIVGMAEFFSAGSRYDCVPDPYYEGAEGFELVLDLLDEACVNLYEALTV